VVDAEISRGGVGTVRIDLTATGGENALGFSLSFDPALLRLKRADLGSHAADGVLQWKSRGEMSGRAGFPIGLPDGAAFEPGVWQVLTLTFETPWY
jgi:hypothetical protein